MISVCPEVRAPERGIQTWQFHQRPRLCAAADVENEVSRGEIRLPRPAKRFFPPTKGQVEVVLRGHRVVAAYDPRVGPDKERSGVVRIGKNELADRVSKGATLMVSRGLGGVPQLD